MSMLSITTRPKKLSDIVGQPTIIRDLQKRSEDWNFPQSIFLEGVSGTGKTSIAHILAALLNCSNPTLQTTGSYEPCGECDSCVDIFSQSYTRDVYYYSSLKKSGVEELQKLAYMRPQFDKNKIFIIDEAQTITDAGKDSALTMLENSSYKNVFFILCTMDKAKIDMPVNSRCQSYTFKPVNKKDMGLLFLNILDNNKIEVPESFISEGGLQTICEYSEGSVRLGLQRLERCVYGEIFTEEEIVEEFGFITVERLFNLLTLLVNKSPDFFNELSKVDNRDFYIFSFTLITEIAKYKTTGYIKKGEEWRKNSYEKLSVNGNLDTLIDIYQAFAFDAASYYFNNALFESWLINYYKAKPLDSRPLLRTRKERTPVA